jgi:hypothetical protein
MENLKKALSQAQERAVADEVSVTRLAQAETEITKLRGEMETLSKAKDEAHAQGIEQGRQEMAMKIRLKDGQISKISKRLQEVEQALATATATDGPVAPLPSQTTAHATDNSPQSSFTAPAPASLKQTTAGATPLGIGRGRGGAIRGGAGRGRGEGRGGSLAAAAAAASSAASVAANANTSILGAAGKRTRESEGDGSQDSLAKRIKPTGGPVSINRNRPLPPDPGS